MNHPTIKYLQEYLKSKDYRGDRPDVYFYKLVEEVGELSRALLLGAPHATGDDTIKGSVEEELWDVMFVMEKGRIKASFRKEDVGDRDLDDLFFEVTGGEKR